jgi:UDP-glucose 4-epimerase
MKCLVAGAAGFIGSNIATRLLADGHSVVGVDDFSAGREIAVPDGTEFICHDLADPAVIDILPQDVDVILQAAGQASGANSFNIPLVDLQQNTASTINLIQYGIRINAKRLIFASSTTVYGDQNIDGMVSEKMGCQPLTCYANAKRAAEEYLRIYSDKLPFVVFRMSNVYGPGQYYPDVPPRGMISVFLGMALEERRVHVMGSLDRFRDFIEVGDVVEAWSRAVMTDKADGQTMNLATGRRTTVGEVLECIKNFVPETEWYVEGSTPGDQLGVYADTQRLKKYLDFEAAVDLNSGIRKFADWCKIQLAEHGAPA